MSLQERVVAAPLSGALEWIDRYVHAVGELLPMNVRGDIETEVRSLLLDEIDQAAPGAIATEAQVIALLRRYPKPSEMANRYGAPQALIGPRYYQPYVTVVTLVVTIALIVSVVAEVATAFTGTSDFSLYAMLGGMFSTAMIAFGVVTLIFASIERSGAKLDEDDAETGWNPTRLPKIEQHNRAKVGELAWDILWSILLILWLNLYVSRNGGIAVFSGEWGTLQIFSTLFVSFIPWLTLAWGAEVVVSIVALARRRWTTVTRLLVVLANGAGVGILTWMLNAGELSGVPIAEAWVRGFIVVAILVSLYDMAGHLWAIFKTETNRAPRLGAALLGE